MKLSAVRRRPRRPFRIAVSLCLVSILLLPLSAQEEPIEETPPPEAPVAPEAAVAPEAPEGFEVVKPPLLTETRSLKGSIDLSGETRYRTFRFEVPEDSLRTEIRIDDAQGDLDLFVRYGGEILDYSRVDASAVSDDYNERLILSRFGESPLWPGEYYLDVAYKRELPPSENGRPLNRLDFTVSLRHQLARAEKRLEAGERISGILQPDEGMMKIYAVEVKDWDRALRIDIADTTGDVDIFVAYENQNLSPESADYSSESLLGRESLVIDQESFPSLQSGTYYILLVDQVSDVFPVAFTLWTSKGREAPAALLDIPPIPDPDDPLQHAIGATAEVIGKEGRGSGCVVSPEGYLLTNWHVVRDGQNRPADPVYIAFTLNQRNPPKELFKGRVVRFDEKLDLALIKIDAGRYGQPIPPGYRFPAFNLGYSEKATIGQPISILGYPSNGGIGSRVSITLTRGVISGFEASPEGTYLKTDGEISFGNSGGAVFDAFGELLGLPASISSDREGKIGFILPVTMIPPSWLKIIEGSH